MFPHHSCMALDISSWPHVGMMLDSRTALLQLRGMPLPVEPKQILRQIHMKPNKRKLEDLKDYEEAGEAS